MAQWIWIFDDVRISEWCLAQILLKSFRTTGFKKYSHGFQRVQSSSVRIYSGSLLYNRSQDRIHYGFFSFAIFRSNISKREILTDKFSSPFRHISSQINSHFWKRHQSFQFCKKGLNLADSPWRSSAIGRLESWETGCHVILHQLLLTLYSNTQIQIRNTQIKIIES